MTTDAVEIRPFRSAHGSLVQMSVREDTVDFDVSMSSIQEDEYRLGDHDKLSGWAIDIGAHIGAVSIALAMDNPELRVLAVEIVPENVQALTVNAALNGVTDRVTVAHAAAGGPDELSRTCFMYHRSHPVAPNEYVNKHRHIGNSFWSLARVKDETFDSTAVEMKVLSLGAMMKQNDIDEVAFLKIDCEGCEWAFLDTPDIAKVKFVVGEYHWDYAPQGDVATRKKGTKAPQRAATAQEELHRLFDKTHDLTVGDHPTIGLFTAVLR